MMWESPKDAGKIMTDEKAREMMAGYEDAYDFYEQIGMASPTVSAKKIDRGDGMKYKINICINWDGGAFGGYNGNRGCGYPSMRQAWSTRTSLDIHTRPSNSALSRATGGKPTLSGFPRASNTRTSSSITTTR